MQQSPTIGALAAALAKAQAKFATPKKSHTAKAGSYSYTYSTLGELIDATRPALTANGLACVQSVSMPDDVNVAVTTMLLHESGEWLTFGPCVLPSGSTPQSAGSAATYGRRYGMGAALSVAAEEDDDAGVAQADAVKSAGKPKPASKPKAAEPDDREAMPPEDDGGPVTVTKITPKPGLKDGDLFYVIEFSSGKTGWTTDEALAKSAIDAADAHDYVVPTLEPYTAKSGKKSIKLTALEVA